MMPVYEIVFKREYSVLIEADTAFQAETAADSINVRENDWSEIDRDEAEQLNETDEAYYRNSLREILTVESIARDNAAAAMVSSDSPHAEPVLLSDGEPAFSRRHLEAAIDIAMMGTTMGVTCDDSRRLVNVYADMAINFEIGFDDESGDYMTAIEDFTQTTLLRNASEYRLMIPSRDEGPASAYLYGLVLDLIKSIENFGPAGVNPAEYALHGPMVKAIDIMTRLYGGRFTEDCNRYGVRFGIGCLGGHKVTMVAWETTADDGRTNEHVEFFSSRAVAIQWFENQRIWTPEITSDPDIQEFDVDVAL